MTRKDVAFEVRIDEELRCAFVEACQAEDRPAAKVVREFMLGYVAERRRTGAVPSVAGHKNTNAAKERRRKEWD